jgi:hypothetical protein
VWLDGNIYYNDANPSSRDSNFKNIVGYDPGIQLTEENGNGYLHFTLDPTFFDFKVKLITGDILGKAKIPKAAFDNADGTSLILDEDYFGNKRSQGDNLAGPFSKINTGKSMVKLW